MRRFMHVVFLGLITLVAITVFFRLREDSMIYFPVKYPEGFWQPREFGVTAEDCFFESTDGTKLHGWYLPQPGTNVTVLWCHGNAGNITHRLDNLKRMMDKVKVNVFIFDYRGYGRSQGSPGERGLYDDARAAYDYLVSQRKAPVNQLVLFGRSLGGAVAVDLALKRPSAGLMIESSFTSARDMARKVFPFLPLHLFLGVKFDSVNKIRQLHLPLLVIHGTIDEVVPFELGHRLFLAANEPKTFYPIQRAGHNDTYLVGGGAYYAKIREFIHRVAGQDRERAQGS